MTIGQLCFYDQIKGLLLGTPYFSDNLVTHFTSSLCAVSFAVILYQNVVTSHIMRPKTKGLVEGADVGIFFTENVT